MVKFFRIIILLAIAIVVLAFAVANRQIVTVSFDPFAPPEASTAIVTTPLFILFFMNLILGIFIGGIAMWFTQGVNRKRARRAQDEAEHWQEQVRRMRDQPPVMTAPPATGRSLARMN